MSSTSSLFIIAIALALTSTNAFTASNIINIRRGLSSPITAPSQRCSTKVSACLDGIYYKPSSPPSEEKRYQMCELGLFREVFAEHSEDFIFNCLTNVVSLDPDEALDLMEQTRKCVAGVMLIDEYTFDKAEYYYDQLAAHGIACTILLVEE